MWSKVEGGRKVSRGRVAPTLTFSIVQHISSKVALYFYLYLFYISADLRIIFLCFDNILEGRIGRDVMAHVPLNKGICVCA